MKGYMDHEIEKNKHNPIMLGQMALLGFAEEVLEIIEERGIKQTELARRAGLDPAQITRVLSAEHNVTIETLSKIASALSMPLHLSVNNPVRVIIGSVELTSNRGAEFHFDKPTAAQSRKEEPNDLGLAA